MAWAGSKDEEDVWVYWVMEERVDTLNDTTAPSIKQYRAAIKKYKSSSESLYFVVTHKSAGHLMIFYRD